MYAIPARPASASSSSIHNSPLHIALVLSTYPLYKSILNRSATARISFLPHPSNNCPPTTLIYIMTLKKPMTLTQLVLLTFLYAFLYEHSSAISTAYHPDFPPPKPSYLSPKAYLSSIAHQNVAKSVNIARNVGPAMKITGTKVVNHAGTITTHRARGVPANVFKTSRQGLKFQLKFNLPAGSYDVELGFVQVDGCNAGSRVFNVLLNGHSRLEAMDIFKEAGGCHKAIVEKFIDQSVNTLKPMPIVIEFQAVSGDATLSFIRIKSSRNQCVPVTTEARLLSNHLAHSVPGTYPPGDSSSYVDRSGRGFVKVNIDGSSSHTHFSYAGGNGKVISYRWIIPETGKLISDKAKFSHQFPLGTTRLKLIVVDNACSKDETETSITVTGNTQKGAYCYYYKGLSALPGPGKVRLYPRPTVAAISSSANVRFPYFPFKNTKFVARCIYMVKVGRASDSTVISVATGGSGIARVYEGQDLIIDTKTATKSAPIVTAVGFASFEVIYQHTNLQRQASLSFKINNKVAAEVFHDQSTVMPILTSISPPSGRIEGGVMVKISGFGLYLPMKIRFGSENVQVKRNGARSTQVFVEAPATSSGGPVDIKAVTTTGIGSNLIKYSYSNDCDDVGFVNKEMKTPSGGVLGLEKPTSISIWQDGKMYIGNLKGSVDVVDYNPSTMVTKSVCHSHKLADSRYKRSNGKPSPRSILGITFDPRDKTPRPYLSVGTIFWQKWGTIDSKNKLAWSNGAIERLKPASAATRARDPQQCLEYDRNIVRNLPVANNDHSVNEIVFTQSGDLLIAVGGFTNMGLPHVDQGGHWETFFSGAVLLAKLSKGASFNGVIPYTAPENLRTAVPKNGYNDVKLYSTGLRNLFSMTMSRSGRIYGLDMGPNVDFGNASSSCDQYKESLERFRNPYKESSFPGKAIVGNLNGPQYSAKRKDKLLEIKEGKFYGHANLQRALHTQKSGECRWVDPDTNKTPRPFNAAPPSNYEAPLALILSPKTGVREYGANMFCGKLRNDLIISHMNDRGVWRAPMFDNGGIDGNPYLMHMHGGIRVEENAHGDLLFPKYYSYPSAGIFAMRPKVSAKQGLFAANAVPFRHGRAGGTLLVIGGWGFTNKVTVKVGNNNCRVVRLSKTALSCKVPRYTGGSNSVSVKVTDGGTRSEIPKAVLYMSV